MTLTTYDTAWGPSNIAALNLSRLLARLEYNLLSSAADLRPLRRSEHQRKRVGANIDYARTTLQNLERSLPEIAPLDRRQTIQSNLARQRLLLNRLQDLLDRLTVEAETHSRGSKQHPAVAFSSTPRSQDEEPEDGSDSDSEPLEGEEDLLGTPEEGSTTDEDRDRDRDHDNNDAVVEANHNQQQSSQPSESQQPQPPTIPSALPIPPTTTTQQDSPLPATTTTTTTATATPPQPQSSIPPQPSSTLRNRSNAAAPSTSSLQPITASGTSLHPESQPPLPSSSPTKLQPTTTEDTLVSDRAEQEDLTSSLLSLASQLKAGSQAFHASLEAEKSVLARAVDGLDRTTGNMEAAERRMGTLRRMTEGKGWWGRMMLYAWIFGLWIVAILIVFVGPKLRF
ncbi:uncharacterized protein BP01DRAFT_289242 [Aspergillus saccharolyticus JOP 1030-1]|uniref:Synaptobrevin n=1 Tax=Aspergillus saccharolyticus JOP 1030-1 TaxID=1450539 RepID=A0A318ZWE2_9EURO|nr:hypothetical protein BP01DRAFT_289242 [Aspergillus saccharolyticus JOP 1030-1]PYH48410.1 hypothetical protein BP01DRAFT_289242 [Aspergillus saccharolyticus JOP 1030-1]